MTTCNRRRFLELAGATAGLTAAGGVRAQGSPTVKMVTDGGNYLFDPIGLHVDPGTTVTFEIASGSHSATAYENRIPTEASPWDSGILSTSGATWEYTFEAAGTHDYYCIPHKSLGMVGRVVVGQPGGPAEGSMPPDGKVPKSSNIVEQGAVSYADFTGTGSGSAGSGDTTTVLTGLGLLGGLAVVATLVYWFGNSEGEAYRVGSAAWNRRYGRE